MSLPPPSQLLGVPKFSQWYPGQEQAFSGIIDWYNSPDRFLGVSAPTGSGKTALALLASKMTGARTVIVTSTKGLQAQYMQDSLALGGVNVLGQNNFTCSLVPSLRADEGPCHDGIPCPVKERCPYRVQLARALSSDIIITNYAYYLAQTNFSSGLGDIDLLVLDESHTAGAFSAMENHLTIHLSRMDVESTGIAFPQQSLDQWAVWKLWAEDSLPLALSKVQSIESEIKNIRDSGISTIPSATSRAFRVAKGILSRLERLSTVSEDWVIQATRHGYMFTPRWVANYGNSLFHDIPKVMLMSAILSHKTLDSIGVPREGRAWLEMDSYFPASNTPIYHIPTARINFRTDDYGSTIWATRIDQLISRRLDRKGIVFTVSYERARMLMARSSYKGIMLTHSTNDVIHVVNKFKEMPAPAVLVSPTVTTGWDFPGNGKPQYIILGKCVPESTKIVTYDGVKSVDDLCIGDLAYSLNSIGEMELSPVTHIYRTNYTGDMVVLKNRSLSMRATPDHRVLMQHHRKSFRYEYRAAETLCGSYSPTAASIPRAGIWRGSEDDVISLRRFIDPDDLILLSFPTSVKERRYIKTLYPFIQYNGNQREWVFRYKDTSNDFWKTITSLNGSVSCLGHHGHIGTPVEYNTADFLSFIGWYASEGFRFENKAANTCGVVICQNKGNNREKIKSLCERLGLHYRVDGGRRVTIVGELLYRAIGYFCPGYAKTKTISPELRLYSPQLLRNMLDTLLAGDGSISRTGARVYYTASEKLAHDVCEIAIKTGSAVRIARENGRGFEVGLRHTSRSNIYGATHTLFSGKVWCPTIAVNGNFLAVEDGCFFFTGNCPYPDTRDPVMRSRHEDDKEWSSFLAMENIVQSSGRCTRSAEDKCEVFFCDDNAKWFMYRYRDFSPIWFRKRWRGSLSSVPNPLV